MGGAREKLEELLASLENKGANVSRATSPGGEPRNEDGEINGISHLSRGRPRTYPYFRYLPYDVESSPDRQSNLKEILKYLYMAIEATDYSPGVVYWTRELKSWLSLKFDLTREQRVKLVKLYYELALAPGVDVTVSERFANMFMILTK